MSHAGSGSLDDALQASLSSSGVDLTEALRAANDVPSRHADATTDAGRAHLAARTQAMAMSLLQDMCVADPGGAAAREVQAALGAGSATKALFQALKSTR